MTRKIRNNQAFTLLELAVVITIIALIGGIGIVASRDMLETANQIATENRLDAIEKALFTFRQKNNRLPCPADATLATTDANYGIEASNINNNCADDSPAANFAAATNLFKAAEGAVPVVTLGLPEDFIYDAWKRKIAYAVAPEFATYNAFNRIPPKSSSCTANTAIRIKDASGADRSLSAIYALVSYGKNGHGAYQATGSTRYNAAASNADEQTNCHCDGSAANTTYDGNYVQRSWNLNSSTAANYFDDIVRYKERWQLIVDEDVRSDDGYRGPDVAVGFVKAPGGTFYTYKNQCGAFIKQADLSPLPTNEPRGVAFTAGNKHLLTYSAAGCNLYKIGANGKLTNLSSAFATACPYNSTAVTALSDNGYLAISAGTASAVISLWKQTGDSFKYLGTLTHSAASVAELSFSPGANLLAVRSATTTSKIYKRKGDSFSAAAADITQPAGLSGFISPRQLIFSPDNKYLAGFNMESPNIYLTIWKIFNGNTASFTAFPKFIPYYGGISTPASFSPDGKYLTTHIVGNSGVCEIEPGDNFCSGTRVVFGHTVANDVTFENDFSHTFTSYAISRYSNYIAATTTQDYINLAKKSHGSGTLGNVNFDNYYMPFDCSGATGISPCQAFDQVLSGSTGGPVAFRK